MKILTLLILMLSLFACEGNQYDSEKAAEDYCSCMSKNGSPGEYIYAYKICEGEMIEKNHYYKIFYVDMAYEHLDRNVSKSTRDSVQQFMADFFDYLNKNCCKEGVGGCPSDSLEYEVGR